LWVAYKAWVDQEFKRRLLAEPSQTLASLGYAGMQAKQKNLVSTASRIVPRTMTGIWLSRHLFWRAMAGLATAMRLKRRWQGRSG
jgi:hypothetical protein